MTRNEQLALVIRLACLTEDRTDAEQRALLDFAWKCDVEHNQNTTGNREREKPDFVLQDLVNEVVETRDPGQRALALPKGRDRRWVLWMEGR